MENVTDYSKVTDAIKSGENVFITGSAGSGKTYLASNFAKTYGSRVALTATTGIAALNLGGETVHRFLGIGIATRQFQASKIVNKWLAISKSSRPWDKARWSLIQNIDTIIIDEISMLRKDQFELIDTVLSRVRDCPMPFGGIQMVLVGDFFQLPPVVTTFDLNKYSDLNKPYCFQSDVWHYAKFKSFNLKLNYRQSENKFLSALEEIRFGGVSDNVNKLLDKRVNVKLATKLQPVKLFPHKVAVSDENMKCLRQLPDDKILSTAEFTGTKYNKDILRKECQADEELYFCKDAQVMMLTNDVESRWVNGTMGVVESIDPVSIKLSNGSTMEVVEHTWERVEHKVKVKANGTKVETTVVATMKQFPFKLAYATTIHKSQGLTLDYVDIDLSKCFTHGQSYVALSRCKTLKGLKLRGWQKSSISAHPAVLKFYKKSSTDLHQPPMVK